MYKISLLAKSQLEGEDVLDILLACYKPDLNKQVALREAGGLLYHVFYQFTFNCNHETTIEFMMNTDLKILHKQTKRRDVDAIIVTGDLSAWKEAVINCTNPDVSFDLKELGKAFFDFFSKEGLQQLFHRYNQKRTEDGTFYLEST